MAILNGLSMHYLALFECLQSLPFDWSFYMLLRMALIQLLRMASNMYPLNGLLECHSVEFGLSKLSMRKVPALCRQACRRCLPCRYEENSCLVQAGMQAICPNGACVEETKCASNEGGPEMLQTKEARGASNEGS